MHRIQTNFQIPHPHFFFRRGHLDATPSFYLSLSSASFALDKTTVVSMWGAGAGRISGESLDILQELLIELLPPHFVVMTGRKGT